MNTEPDSRATGDRTDSAATSDAASNDIAPNDITRSIHEYLFERHFPLWLEHGWDPVHGGFREALTPEFHPLDARAPRRLLVQCRQIYAHSHAFMLTGVRELAQRAVDAVDAMVLRYRDADHGGWYFSVSPNGEIVDPRKDTYGHAFVLFALAYYYRATADSDALGLAAETADVMERHLADSRHGGLAEGSTRDFSILDLERRRQNPHMHLLEGYLALAQFTRETRYREGAERLLGLFRERFFDSEQGTIGEYYTGDWRRHPEDGQRIEAGHHFEWAWLLDFASHLLDAPEWWEIGDRLIHGAESWGWDPEHGGYFDELHGRERVHTDSKRIWPLAESIKAYAVRFERGGSRPGSDAMLRKRIEFLFRNYLRPDGGWHEQLDRTLQPLRTDLPGSTSYHITLALTEALRVLSRPRATE